MTIEKRQDQRLRIITGEFRHRRINFSVGKDLRPTAARIRETLFNWLTPDIVGKICLDLFAGSGILGFEALSRGARSVTFVDNNRATVKQLAKNGRLLKTDKYNIIHGDYRKAFDQTYDIIFLDPPYSLRLLPQLLEQVKALQPQYIFLEDKQPLSYWLNNRSDYHILKSKRAGDVHFALLCPSN